MARTKIEWAERVWNPVTGCSKVSAGCLNCYEEDWPLAKVLGPMCRLGRWNELISEVVDGG